MSSERVVKKKECKAIKFVDLNRRMEKLLPQWRKYCKIPYKGPGIWLMCYGSYGD